MARRTRTITRTVVARAPTPTIRVSVPNLARAAGRGIRRGGRRVASAAYSEKHTLTAIGAAIALGYAEKEKFPIPSLFGFSPATTAGVIAWAVGKYGRNRIAMHVATGLLCVAANRWMSGAKVSGGVGVVFDDDDVDG